MPPTDGACVGARPARAASRTAWRSDSDGDTRAAMSANATCQPNASARIGSTAPASAAPAGTPVCLIENVNAIRDGGAVRARICGRGRRDRSVAHADDHRRERERDQRRAGKRGTGADHQEPAAHSSTQTCDTRIGAVARDEHARGEARSHRPRVDEADENADQLGRDPEIASDLRREHGGRRAAAAT